MKPVALTLLVLALTGCSMAPTYERPAAPVPAAYDTPTQSGQAEMPQDWKDYFNDPALRAWIAAALANNRDLRVAALRIEEARAVRRAARRPAAVRGRHGRLQPQPRVRSRPVTRCDQPAVPRRRRHHRLELDFFGRIKSLTDAALERYLASAEAHRAAALSLVAETATAYFNERSLAEQQRLTRSTLELRETTLTLTQRRYDAGLETAMGRAPRRCWWNRRAPRWPNSAASTARPCMRWACWRVISRCRPTPTRRRWKARALPRWRPACRRRC